MIGSKKTSDYESPPAFITSGDMAKPEAYKVHRRGDQHIEKRSTFRRVSANASNRFCCYVLLCLDLAH